MVPQPILVPPGAVVIEPAKKASTRSSLEKSTKTAKTHADASYGQLVLLLGMTDISAFVQLCPPHLSLSVESPWIRKARSRGMFYFICLFLSSHM